MSRKVVVTGGGGFIGAHLVKRLVANGDHVVVVDNMVRGEAGRLQEVVDSIELSRVDVRDAEGLSPVFEGAQVVIHLAAINGTDNFYRYPEQVLDVGIRGAIAVVNACRDAGVPDLVVASSAEVYQSPDVVPTPESVEVMLPDTLNPRYSYGGSKIASELIAFNYGREHFSKVQVFRPHNIYGPDMGWKHVVPQFIARAEQLKGGGVAGPYQFDIQGDGKETRAFCYVDDAIDGILTMYEHGESREIYHIGNDGEIAIEELVARVGEVMDVQLVPRPTPAPVGGTRRRCPDITKMRAIGYEPRVGLLEGLKETAAWYAGRSDAGVSNKLL